MREPLMRLPHFGTWVRAGDVARIDDFPEEDQNGKIHHCLTVAMDDGTTLTVDGFTDSEDAIAARDLVAAAVNVTLAGANPIEEENRRLRSALTDAAVALSSMATDDERELARLRTWHIIKERKTE